MQQKTIKEHFSSFNGEHFNLQSDKLIVSIHTPTPAYFQAVRHVHAQAILPGSLICHMTDNSK